MAALDRVENVLLGGGEELHPAAGLGVVGGAEIVAGREEDVGKLDPGPALAAYAAAVATALPCGQKRGGGNAVIGKVQSFQKCLKRLMVSSV